VVTRAPAKLGQQIVSAYSGRRPTSLKGWAGFHLQGTLAFSDVAMIERRSQPLSEKKEFEFDGRYECGSLPFSLRLLKNAR
jgi:hypothetical protein